MLKTGSKYKLYLNWNCKKGAIDVEDEFQGIGDQGSCDDSEMRHNRVMLHKHIPPLHLHMHNNPEHEF